MNKNYLLDSRLARQFYKEIKALPIVDYHNHLDINAIKENKRFTDIYELWIKVDPYKHRALRMLGVDENLITGSASSEEKFNIWCEKFPLLVGNPLYVWAPLELEAIFGIKLKICKENATKIYELANNFLANNNVTVSYLLDKFNVKKICPCFSLLQDISYISKQDRSVPSLRGDDFLVPTIEFVNKLSEMSNIEIKSIDDYISALSQRISEFNKVGCVFSDHALDNGFKYFADDEKNNKRFLDLLKGKLDTEDALKLKSYILTKVLGVYSELNMVTQLHIGAQRTTSDKLRKLAGPAGGYAALGNDCDIQSITNLFNDVEKSEKGLGKIILFTLNPVDNELLSTLAGSYSKEGMCSLISQGPAWWWSDHDYAIRDVLDSISSYSVLSNFIGMTTDSRSFLSLIRHDYFRRILSSFLANKINEKRIPYDKNDMKVVLKKVCFENADKLFD